MNNLKSTRYALDRAISKLATELYLNQDNKKAIEKLLKQLRKIQNEVVELEG